MPTPSYRLIAISLLAPLALAAAWAVLRTPAGEPTEQPVASPAAPTQVTPSGPEVSLGACPPASTDPAGVDEPYFRLVRGTEAGETDLPDPVTGAAYVPAAGGFLTVGDPQVGSGAQWQLVSPIGDATNVETEAGAGGDQLMLAYDPTSSTLLGVAADGEEIVRLPLDRLGRPLGPAPEGVVDISSLGLRSVSGIAVARDARIRLLTEDGTMVVLPPLVDAGWDPVASARSGDACFVQVASDAPQPVRGLAVDEAARRMYVSQGALLLELDANGQVLHRHELPLLAAWQNVALALGPSGDPTDLGEQVHLYALGGPSGEPTRLVEISFSPPQLDVPEPVSDVHAIVRQVIDTSDWAPPSSDPGGLAVDPVRQALVVTDGEVDEQPIFGGANVWEVSLVDYSVQAAWLTAFSPELTDVAVDVVRGRRYFSDDSARMIFEVDRGRDAMFGTPDDKVTTIDTTLYGSFDPEGLAFGNGELFVSDGLAQEIYRIGPGTNGVFDGPPPAGDDIASQFDTAGLGQPDPEGIAFNPESGNLLIVSNESSSPLTEVTPSGQLVRTIDLGRVSMVSPGGVAVYSNEGVPVVVIADRGVDNAVDPDQNDGRLFVVELLGAPPPNLVSNPGFEEDRDGDGTPDLWSLTGDTRRTGASAHEGSFALELRPGQVGSADARQTVRGVVPDEIHAFSAWVRFAAPGPAELRVRVQWHDLDGRVLQRDRLLDSLAPPVEWTRVSGSAQAPPGAVSARLVISVRGVNTQAYLDAVEFGRP